MANVGSVSFTLQVSCRKSRDKGTLYHVLEADLGYRVATLSLEKDVISEILGLPISAIYNMKEGDKFLVIPKNLSEWSSKI